MITTDFRDLIAERIRSEHQALAARWFDRLLDLVPVEAREVFPTDTLLDHVPALILEISRSLARQDDMAMAANTTLLGKARELGALRHAQRASLHQVIREYQLLGGVLVAFVVEQLDRLEAPPRAIESATVVARLHQAVNMLAQSTVETFVALYTETIAAQTERLEQFTRMAAHEWRQPLGALQFGVKLLRRPDLDPAARERALDAVERTAMHLVELTGKLEAVARMQTDGDNPVVQDVSAATLAHEAARQLRDMADARGVSVRIDDALPALTVDTGRLELIFVNLLSNAIKYSDPAKDQRYVEVTGGMDAEGWRRFEVRDNGIGIPAEALPTIFGRFTRVQNGHGAASGVGGVGLGLSIVEDCVHAIGGRIEVESQEGRGTTFILRVPGVPAAS